MPPLTLEERVATLEQQVAEIMAHSPQGAFEKPWLRTMGIFGGDPLMKEIFDEALRYRQRDRERARRGRSKNSSTDKSSK